jgi:hypothetical protein
MFTKSTEPLVRICFSYEHTADKYRLSFTQIATKETWSLITYRPTCKANVTISDASVIIHLGKYNITLGETSYLNLTEIDASNVWCDAIKSGFRKVK